MLYPITLLAVASQKNGSIELNKHCFRTNSIFRISWRAMLHGYERFRCALTPSPSEATPPAFETGLNSRKKCSA